MSILKKIKCIHCGSVVEQQGSCECGKVKINNGNITEGVCGSDYIDISLQVLTES